MRFQSETSVFKFQRHVWVCRDIFSSVVYLYLRFFSFYRQLASGDIAPFSVVQLEVIFNPAKPGNALAEFEISFSDPLSPPVSKKCLRFFSDVLSVSRKVSMSQS